MITAIFVCCYQKYELVVTACDLRLDNEYYQKYIEDSFRKMSNSMFQTVTNCLKYRCIVYCPQMMYTK